MRFGRARLAQGYGSDQLPLGGMIGGSPVEPSDPGQIGAGEGPDTIDLSPRFRPWSEPAQGSTVPLKCHFLRTVSADGRLTEAQATAVPTHRCAAFGDPLPLSLRQQELVCLQRVHVSCPRYVRGTLLASEAEAQPEGSETKARFPLMTVVAIGFVVLGILVLVTGGLGLFGGGKGPGPTATAPLVANVSPSASTSAGHATPTPTVAPTDQTKATPTPTATPAPTPTPTPAATPTPAPTPASPTWPPGATASRMNLLTPCTDQPNCWVYTVRSAAQNGSKVDDQLPGIVTFFGVKMSAVLELNPWAAAGIQPGQQLKIPPPTR
jgi:hypothetical protein